MKTSLSAHEKECFWGLKREGTPLHSKCGHAPTGLYSGNCLSKKLHTHLRQDPWASQAWTEKQDNRSEVNKDLEGQFYINDLHHLLLIPDDRTSLWACLWMPALLCRCASLPDFWLMAPLLIREDAHTLSGVYLRPDSELDKQALFLCALPYIVLCL